MGCSSSALPGTPHAVKSTSDMLGKDKKTRSSHSDAKISNFGRSKSVRSSATPKSGRSGLSSATPTSAASEIPTSHPSSAGKRTTSTLSHKFFRKIRTSTTASLGGTCCGTGAACNVDVPGPARSDPETAGSRSRTTSEPEAAAAKLEGAVADVEASLTEKAGASAALDVVETSEVTLPVLIGSSQSQMDSKGKYPPANLLRDEVLKECSAILRQANGTLRKPTLKLALQGRYIFTNVETDPAQVANSTSPPRLQYYAATSRHASNGKTLESVLRAVQAEAQLGQLSDLIHLLPDIEEAMSNELSGREVKAVDAVVYHCVNAEVDTKDFFDWLNFDGFEMWPIDGFAEGVTLRAGIRDDRQALRITSFQDGVCVDAAYNVSSSV